VRRNRLALLSGRRNATAMLDSIGETFATALREGATLIRLPGNIRWAAKDGRPKTTFWGALPLARR
jgi:hypothetical protein